MEGNTKRCTLSSSTTPTLHRNTTKSSSKKPRKGSKSKQSTNGGQKRIQSTPSYNYKKTLKDGGGHLVRVKPVCRGTISILTSEHSQERTNYVEMKKDLPLQSKLKIKYKTIQWLNENKPDAINALTRHNKSLATLAGQKKAFNREEFGELLACIGIGHDQNLVNKLFWLFDDDGSGDVDYKELVVGLEMFKNNTLEEKLEVFFDLCDEDNSGTIDEIELYRVLKLSLTSSDERANLRRAVKDLFREIDIDGDGEITREEFFLAARKNENVRNLVEQNVKNLQNVDKWIDNDLERPFHSSLMFGNADSGGYDGPYLNKLVEVIKEKEETQAKYTALKQNIIQNMRRVRGKNEFDSDTESDESI